MSCPTAIQAEFFTLQKLATYASCSVRWLRSRLVDAHNPLPHFKVGGKVLVKREEFDQWMAMHRMKRPADHVSGLVDTVVAQLQKPRRIA